MIDRFTIAADTTWSVGQVGATIRADITCETIRSDARKGSESDGLAVNLPSSLAPHFDPPPLGRTATVIADGETIAEGIITKVRVESDGIRIQVDL